MKARILLVLTIFACVGMAAVVQAQERPQAAAAQTSASVAASLDNQGIRNYLLGPGDTLDVRVFGQPDFNSQVDVDSDGNVVLPFIDKPIAARCRTERDVAKDITAAYSKYLKNPQVSVRITGRNSRPPAIIHGAVAAPQRVQMQRTVRLNELLAVAGGVTERSNGMIEVLHTEAVMCPAPGEVPDADEVIVEGTRVPQFKRYLISDLLAGKEGSNPVIRPGDVIRALEADPIYITGSVGSPQGVYLRPNMSLQRALAMVGGAKKEANLKDIRIYRQTAPGKEPELIRVDLAAIKKGQKEDVVLKPYDIIEVPEASPFTPSRLPSTLLGGFNSAINSIGASLPLRVIY